MSSATTPTAFDRAEALTVSSGKGVFRLKLTAQSVFGFLLLLDSLFLVLCYVTFDFYGALTSPFFAWLRRDAFVAHVLYFPAFAAAVLAIDVGLTGRTKRWAQKSAAMFLLAQIGIGFLLYFLPGRKEFFGWVFLFGPNVRMPSGEIVTYCESIACLIPLGWISIIHIATSFRAAAGEQKLRNTMGLSSFLIAGIATPLLYQGIAKARESVAGQPFSFSALSFSIVAHLLVFLAIFLVLQWIQVIAGLFRSPRLTQFAFRCFFAWIVLAAVMRKVIFSLLAFNNGLADWYAAVFSCVLVLFAAALVLKIRTQRENIAEERVKTPAPFSWIVRVVVVVFFYFCAVKLAPIDWAHILGSLTALGMWVLLLWFMVAILRPAKGYALKFLTLLSIVTVAGLAGVRIAVVRPALADMLDQYAAYDSSLFVVQNSFKPALQDDKYSAWYGFLAKHAGIRAPISAPEVPLANEFRAVSTGKPNIFILVIDALRRDYVSSYNPAVNFTPHIQAFAQESAVFQHAYSFYAGTALADPAIWSGFQQINKIFVKPLSRENNLQPMLRKDGYHSYISYNPIVAALVDKSDGVTGLSTDLSDRQQKEFSAVVDELEDDLLKRKDPERPVFAFSQPANVHTLSLAWHGQADVRSHPGFDDKYSSAVEKMDQIFGEFVAFLKKQGLYENSVIILTSDHGESLGEMGRESHVSNLTPEVIEIPLIIHLPERQKSQLVWNGEDVVSLHDITPTLYYLAGHRDLKSGEMLGRPLFTRTWEEQKHQQPDHYFLMSSYGAIFGVLSADRKSLFYVDATLQRNYYYDLQADPHALKNRVTAQVRDYYEQLIRQDLEKIDKFYGVSEKELE